MSDVNTGLTEDQRRTKEQFVADLGFWPPELDALLKIDPEYLDRFRALAAYPRNEGILEPKVQAFIRLAMDCATTQLYADGTRRHVGEALDHGATVRELVEVMELASVLGFHSILDGTEVLLDVAGPADLDDEQQATAERLSEQWASYWAEEWDDIASLDPDYLAEFIEFSAYPWQGGVLPPRVKELVYIAVDVSTTHLYKTGLRFHVENALENTDLTPEEIMAVFELACAQGFNTVPETMPIILDEAGKRGLLPEEL